MAGNPLPATRHSATWKILRLPVRPGILTTHPPEEKHMVHEFARLHVIAGQENVFEAAFAEAQHIIAAMPGFIGLSLYRQHPDGQPYLLHVRRESVEAHRDGFRQSPQYQQWKALLHHFYDPFPTVEYFSTLFER